jgi:hypothetical protein
MTSRDSSPDSIKNEVDDKLNKTKKNLSFQEVYQLVKSINAKFKLNQEEEIMNELGISNKNDDIEIENLINVSKEKRASSKFADFYDNLLNVFITPSERIMKILEECKDLLEKEYKHQRLVSDLEWVIGKINNDDIYNLNVDLLADLDKNKINGDIENTIKFFSEYSADNFNKNKVEDVKAARRLSNKRMQSPGGKRNSRSIVRNYSVVNKEPFIGINQFSLSPDADQSWKAHAKTSVSFLAHRFYLSEKPVRHTDFDTIKEEDENIHHHHKGNIDYNSNNEDDKHKDLISDYGTNIPQGEIKTSILNNNNVENCPFENEKTGMEVTNSVQFATNHMPYLDQSEVKNSIDSVDFNIFEYANTYGRENVLINVSDYIWDRWSLYMVINSQRFETFLDKIRVGYDYLLPYHNDLHATDVLQTCHLFTIFSNLKAEIDLTMLDLSGLFIAAIIHDFKHPGLNNAYHINKKTTIATRYNDISVLENFHVSAAFKVISHPNSNIFCDLQVEEYRVVRKRIVECVLATDMAKHTKSQTSLKIKIDQLKSGRNSISANKILYNIIQTSNEDTKFDRQQEILNFLIHCADISNAGKKFFLAKTWTSLVMEEFFKQGDKEKYERLPVSFLCDRDSTNIPKSQLMFIGNICIPCFKILSMLSPNCDVFLKNMIDNQEAWKKEEEEAKASIN